MQVRARELAQSKGKAFRSGGRTGGVEVEDGLVVQVLLGHDGLDDVLHEVSVDLVVGDVGRVLCGDEDGVHADGGQGAALLLVLHCHLGLAVWPQPADCAVLAHLRPVTKQRQQSVYAFGSAADMQTSSGALEGLCTTDRGF